MVQKLWIAECLVGDGSPFAIVKVLHDFNIDTEKLHKILVSGK
jgi:hypothetical protein